MGAWWSAIAVEKRSAAAVKTQLLISGVTWATVTPDGLQIRLTGTAPNEAARFRLVNLVATVVQSARIRDRLEVAALRAIEPPRFSVEILRNDEGISLIGLVPGKEREAKLAAAVTVLARGTEVADMLETADFPPPDTWDEALDFGLFALKLLPRSKISVSEDLVAITAISGSATEKRRLESDLARALPDGVRASINISAPRPVLTPFTLRFVKDDGGARFDACSADTDRARDKIISAGVVAGVSAKTTCTVGLGVPTPRWSEAAELAIRAVAAVGSGTVTFSDADVSFVADASTPQAVFDRVTGDLQTQLPPVFSLKAVLTPKPGPVAQGPAEFTADLDENGKAQLRGRLTDSITREAVDSFAKAQFGADRVYTGTRPDEDLPDGWPVRVLAGLEALAQLHHGSLTVQAAMVDIRGVTGKPDGNAKIAQILSDKLGQGQTFSIDVTYDAKYDPQAALPSPDECVGRLNDAINKHKIIFAPGSAEIEGDAQGTIDTLAEILAGCPPLETEIGGYTDSQGSEGGNRALSQARAEAVLTALQGRRLKMGGFIAIGYGEENPVADNGTEDGREANRRIEFRLLSEPVATPRMSPLDLVRATQQTQAAAQLAAETGAEAEQTTADDQAMPASDDAAGVGAAPGGDDFGSGDGDDSSADDMGSGDEGSDAASADDAATDAGSGDALSEGSGISEGSGEDDSTATPAAAETPQPDTGDAALPDPGAEEEAGAPDETPEFVFEPSDEKWPRPRSRP